MPEELIYTSAPRGLKPGSSGFCTVAATQALASGPVAARLESLSGYIPLYPVGHPSSANNPVRFSHIHLGGPGGGKSVLSRIAFAGPDHTGRTNKIAHHLLIISAERTPAGPAWLLLRPDLLRESWHGDPELLHARGLPKSDANPVPAATWQRLAGDAGWAGVVAEALLNDRDSLVHVLYEGGANPRDILAMVDESIRLLPTNARWNATFSTYHTEQVAGADCRLRFCVIGTPAAEMAKRSTAMGGLLIDLTNGRSAPDTAAALAARSGNAIAPETAARASDASIGPATSFVSRRPPVGQQPFALSPSAIPVTIERAVDDDSDDAELQQRPFSLKWPLITAAAAIPILIGGLIWLMQGQVKPLATASTEAADEVILEDSSQAEAAAAPTTNPTTQPTTLPVAPKTAPAGSDRQEQLVVLEQSIRTGAGFAGTRLSQGLNRWVRTMTARRDPGIEQADPADPGTTAPEDGTAVRRVLIKVRNLWPPGKGGEFFEYRFDQDSELRGAEWVACVEGIDAKSTFTFDISAPDLKVPDEIATIATNIGLDLQEGRPAAQQVTIEVLKKYAHIELRITPSLTTTINAAGGDERKHELVLGEQLRKFKDAIDSLKIWKDMELGGKVTNDKRDQFEGVKAIAVTERNELWKLQADQHVYQELTRIISTIKITASNSEKRHIIVIEASG